MVLSPHKAHAPATSDKSDDQEEQDTGEDESDQHSVHKGPSPKPSPSDEVQTVKVPPSLRGRGYTLLIGSYEAYPLDRETVRIKQTDWVSDQILVDASGRVLATDRGYVDNDMLNNLEPREFRLGIIFGSTSFNGAPLKRIFLPEIIESFTLNFEYQPSAIGFFLQQTSLYSDQGEDDGVIAKYHANQTRTGATYELAPVSSWRKFSLLLKLGATYTRHYASVEDASGEVKLESEFSNVGYMFGSDFRYNWRNFYLTMSLSWIQQKIEFEELDFETNTVQSNFEWLGGSYAF